MASSDTAAEPPKCFSHC